MNWVDLLIVAIIAWSTFRAFSNGLVRELVTLIGVVLGIVLAGAFYDNLSANLEFIVDDPPTRGLAAFAAIFVGTAVASQVIGMVLKGVAAVLLLGPFDHIGGALFGLLKGVLIVSVLLIAVSVFPAQATVSRTVDDSTLAPLFLERLPLVQRVLPDEFGNPLNQLDRWRRLREGAMPVVPSGPGALPR